MNQLSDTNKRAINLIKTAFNQLSWYEKFFFPSTLATQLNRINDENPSIENAFHVYEAYLNCHNLELKPIKIFSKTDLVCALSNIETADHLTNNVERLANFTVIAAHQHPKVIANALSILQTAGLLTGDTAQASRDAFANHKQTESVSNALSILQTAGFLTGDTAQANWDAVVKHKDISSLAYALSALHTAGLLNGDTAQANLNAVAQLQAPGCRCCNYVLTTLQSAGLLNDNNAQTYFDAIVNHPDPRAASLTLQIFEEEDLLTKDTTQDYFDAVLILYPTILLARDPGTKIIMWLKLDQDLLTANHVQNIIDLARINSDNPPIGIQVVNDYINANILPQARVAAINTEQNTQQHNPSTFFNQNQNKNVPSDVSLENAHRHAI